jgi:hypothetical protein
MRDGFISTDTYESSSAAADIISINLKSNANGHGDRPLFFSFFTAGFLFAIL